MRGSQAALARRRVLTMLVWKCRQLSRITFTRPKRAVDDIVTGIPQSDRAYSSVGSC